MEEEQEEEQEDWPPKAEVSGEGPLYRDIVFYSGSDSRRSKRVDVEEEEEEEEEPLILLFYQTLVNGTPIDYHNYPQFYVMAMYTRTCQHGIGGDDDDNDDDDNNNKLPQTFDHAPTRIRSSVISVIVFMGVLALLSVTIVTVMVSSYRIHCYRWLRNCKRRIFFYQKDENNLVESKDLRKIVID